MSNKSQSPSQAIKSSTKTKKFHRRSQKKQRRKIPLRNDLWPQERDLLVRPERYKYVRKMIHAPGCVFCKALKKGVGRDSLILFSNAQVIVMLNKYPYNTGHLLVLPAQHCGQLLELSEKEYFAVQYYLRLAFQAIMKCYQPSGCNIGLNHGKAAGAGLPDHLHWHIVPRWTGDTNFFPLIAKTKVLVESLDQTYDKLKRYF